MARTSTIGPSPFGLRLDAIRLRRQKSIADVARAAGAAWTTVNAWLKHGQTPNRAALAALIRGLELTPGEVAELVADDPELTPGGGSAVASEERAAPTQDEASAIAGSIMRAYRPAAHSAAVLGAVLLALRDGAAVVRRDEVTHEAAGAWLDAGAEIERRGAPITAAAICALLPKVLAHRYDSR